MNNIRLDIAESIATLTIDRPAVKNALNLETVQECHRALDELATNADVGVLIITGAGETAFVSGADINDIRARTRPTVWPRSTRRCSRRSSGSRDR